LLLAAHLAAIKNLSYYTFSIFPYGPKRRALIFFYSPAHKLLSSSWVRVVFEIKTEERE
jgi:hypothetical protein